MYLYRNRQFAPIIGARRAKRTAITVSVQPSATTVEHPFQNYWTKDGGLAEVITVLPKRERALSLVENFFASVDPLYPMLSREDLIAEMEHLWAMSLEDKYCYDAAKLALHFVVYAAGAYFAPDIEPDERGCMADIYLSASHQSLCLCSYLGKFSLGTAQVILLIGHLLINTNRISEAWTFSGILVRQAYALRLHRSLDSDPGGLFDQHRQLQRRIWQAVVVQDVSIAYHLHLPPSAVRCIERLNLVDPMIETDFEPDVAYEQSMWQWATFVQEHICIPQAIGTPITTSASHKTTLIACFRDMYSNWKYPFNSQNPKRFETVDLRLARQLVTITSSFFGVLTVLYLDENPDAGVFADVYGSIDATHEALSSFFALLRLSPEQMDMWGSYHTRAYAQAVRYGD
ncbi:hypothetical protein M409DRAFT_70140 [Zasmidium cellare ATCC 36951]|uniref:Xylanolytic transcriptional activator regulatory domain-containing protein n=1 Tax=Zasmidium cellare ATCC 36951 TaxID=1080233 RepID=A0A6A6C193_ZASCE|nr:uncharacterized protein M409DRAFT_70140 [Zasmidium cellare ATCC 36951]KAF2160814.1 hypothetical protein M409DRAFT_70140 [Zasmidium cellare ATCC 36951]